MILKFLFCIVVFITPKEVYSFLNTRFNCRVFSKYFRIQSTWNPSNNNEIRGGRQGSKGNEFENSSMNQVRKTTIPSRYDSCFVIASGVIGVQPKEVYLSNGHYVLSFSLAVVGHFTAVHEWEKMKPAETMWLQCEVWDDQGKTNLPILKKGASIKCLGTLLSNKWVDKNTGEERKQFRLRIAKFLSENDMQELLNSVGSQCEIPLSIEDEENGTNFSNNFPEIEDQTLNHKTDQSSVMLNSKPKVWSPSGNRMQNNMTDLSWGKEKTRIPTGHDIPLPTTWDSLDNEAIETSQFWFDSN